MTGAFGGGAVLPQWFGAKADGVSDDAPALTKALAFPRVFLPAGTYLVGAPLPLVAGASLEGEALDQAYIDWDQDFERETPSSSASLRDGGRRTPRGIAPATTSRRICPAIWSNSGSGPSGATAIVFQKG